MNANKYEANVEIFTFMHSIRSNLARTPETNLTLRRDISWHVCYIDAWPIFSEAIGEEYALQ